MTLYCCLTGNRKIPKNKMEYVREELRKEVQQALSDGYTWFCCGFDSGGADQLFAEIVLEERKKNEEIMLDAYLASSKRLDKRSQALFCSCTAIYYTQNLPDGSPIKNYYYERDFNMIRISGRVIAVYDGAERSRTAIAMNHARNMNRELRVIEF